MGPAALPQGIPVDPTLGSAAARRDARSLSRLRPETPSPDRVSRHRTGAPVAGCHADALGSGRQDGARQREAP